MSAISADFLRAIDLAGDAWEPLFDDETNRGLLMPESC